MHSLPIWRKRLILSRMVATTSSGKTDMKILTGTTAAEKPDPYKMVTAVVNNGGPNPWAQLLQLLGYVIRGTGVRPGDYYKHGFWMRDIDPAFRKELVPKSRKHAYNGALMMPGLGLKSDVIEDKIETEVLLRKHGFSTSLTLAVYGGEDSAAHVEHLNDVDDIVEFLTRSENPPLFAKPRSGSLAAGSIAIQGLARDGVNLVLTNGVEVSPRALAEEIVTDWPAGYTFQKLYRSERTLQRHSGMAMASLRIVTLLTDRGVEPFNAVMRFPSATAMHDGASLNTRVWAHINLEDGKALRVRAVGKPHLNDLTHWQDKDNPVLGYTIPHWDQAIEICTKAHELFPGHGILGWDVFITDDEALINEINANPNDVYQTASGLGLNNPDLKPVYDRAVAYARSKNGTK